MQSLALIFAILAGVSVGSYNTLQKVGSTLISPALGAVIVSIVAATINLIIVLSMKIKGQEIIFTTKGLFVLIFVGVAAAGIDLFGLLAYSKGLKLTSTFIMTGVSATIICSCRVFNFKRIF